jgi:ring-1,2-phenylacetyl-CoA epoxidase subunit PaaD
VRLTEEKVWSALGDVFDPELPSLSVVDLGVIRSLALDGTRVRIEFTPTYLGCPGLKEMRDRIAARMRALGAEPEVEIVLDELWSTDRVTPAGRRLLREAGIAVPALAAAADPELSELRNVILRCPHCGSANTRLEHATGPTPCRAIRYCTRCGRTFEQLKAV